MANLDTSCPSLSKISKQSALHILAGLAAGFSNKKEYLQYLEGVALIAFKDALCVLEEKNLEISPTNRSDNAFGRAAAFLMQQERETTRRMNQAVCGSEIIDDAVQVEG